MKTTETEKSAAKTSSEIEPMALIAAVTFGSTAALAMPIGYQTSLMIYDSGGYRVKDFVRMGIVLDILLAQKTTISVPFSVLGRKGQLRKTEQKN